MIKKITLFLAVTSIITLEAFLLNWVNPLSSIKEVAGTTVAAIPLFNKSNISFPPTKSSSFNEFNANCKASELVDVESSYVLYEKNATTKVPIASTTKIMTATLILDKYSDRLDEIVTIKPKSIAVEGSDIKLVAGERISVENLLNGLLIMSGNDTAYALADHFGGKDAFVREMNEYANKLGLNSTNYKDPAGLDDEGYSTAHDLAMLGSFAVKNEKFAKIISTGEKTITSADGRILHELKSSNRLILPDEPYFLNYASGIKTGFTYAAGHCLVSLATKDDHALIGVVLNTDEDTIFASAKESKKLLEWGFANWVWQ